MTSVPKKEKIRKRLVLTFGALVYALLFALGSQMEQYGATQPGETIKRLPPAFCVAFGVLWVLLEKILPRHSDREKAAEKPFRTGLAFLLIVACYVPIFLIYYPGTFAYDTQVQAEQVVYHAYTQFHPLAHTLFLGACLSLFEALGSLEKCAAVYSAIQIIILGEGYALSCASISRSCSRRAARVCTAVFALWPYHMIFASTCTKDVLFSGFLTLFFALTLELQRVGTLTKPRLIILVISGMLACLLRNNMIYAMLVWVALLMLFGKGVRRIACYALIAAILSIAANQGLAAATQAGKGNIREMFSVPMQQLSRAHRLAPEVFTEEEQQALDTYLRDRGYERYNPTLADPVKWCFNNEAFEADPAGAAKLWLSIGRKCPSIYLDAFLDLMLPFLYPTTTYRVTPEYIDSGSYGGVLTALYTQPPIVHPSRFDAVRAWLDVHIWANGADEFPLLRWVFNAGLVIWLMGLCVLHAMYAGRWKRFAVLLLPVLLWGTYLLGPVVQGRYVYPFVCLLPLMLAVCKTKEE